MSGIIIRGNVVTKTEILFNGWIEVVSQNITKIGRSDEDIPAAYAAAAAGESNNNSKSSNKKIVTADWIIPGFVDIHNHGLGGCDEVIEHWEKDEGFAFSLRELARCGTTSVLTSLILAKDKPERTARMAAAVESRVGRSGAGCVIEGIHVEGPIIRDCGGLPPQHVDMGLEQFKQLVALMPSMKIMTISPSLEAAFNPPFARTQHLVDCGIRPSFGHDRVATAEDIRAALGATSNGTAGGGGGAKRGVTYPEGFGPAHTTHFCNVMGFHHRDPSLVNFTLVRRFPKTAGYRNAQPPTTEAIMDLVHVHGLTLQALLSARDPQSVAVISDCISNYAPGKLLKYNGRSILVKSEGGCYLADDLGRPTLTLAGSTVTIADQFFTLMTVFGLDVVSACLITATTPATIAKIDKRVGSIEVGKKANLLLLDGGLSKIMRRMIYGEFLDQFPEPYIMLRPAHNSHL